MAAEALRRLLRVAAIVVGCLGLGSVVPVRAQAAVEPLAAVQAVLDAQVTAVRTGNRAAFLSTIDPKAPQSLRHAQARRFDGLRGAPLEHFALRARIDQSGDLGPAVAGKYAGVRVFLPQTQQATRLRGYDDRDARDDLWLTFVEREGRWYVASDDDVADVGLDSARAFWDLGPVRYHETAHFLVLSRPEQAKRADALAAVAEEAVGALDKQWAAPWSHRVPLIVPGSTKELEVMLQSTVDLDKFVAFASYGFDVDAGYAGTAARIYVNDRNLSRYSKAEQVQTLVHELNHVAASGLAGPATPLWVHEGIAEWVSRPGASTRRPSGVGPHFPRDHEYVSGAQGAIVRAYASGRTAITAMVGIAGPGAPAAFMTELGRDRIAAGTQDYLFGLALTRATRLGVPDLERAWASAN